MAKSSEILGALIADFGPYAVSGVLVPADQVITLLNCLTRCRADALTAEGRTVRRYSGDVIDIAPCHVSIVDVPLKGEVT